MASVVAYTKQSLIQRIRKHISNGYANDDFTTTDRELMLYIDQALAYNAVGQIYAGAKVMGTIDVPEGYLTTYALSALVQDAITGEWYATLPQPPVSLPLGYSITRAYFANASNGASQDILPVKAKRAAYRNNMPKPAGAQYRIVNGSLIYISDNDGAPLFAYPVFVEMLNTRTSSIDETLNLPDDAIEGIFNNVIQKLIQRYAQPKDIVKDDIGAGNTTQKS